MSEVELRGVTKLYGTVAAADRIDLVVQDGEFFSLLGPSGSGKTTVLRLIAGFIQPDSGVIRIGDREMQGIPPERRSLGMVFQNYALFPHLTVADNIAFGLSVKGAPRDEIKQRVDEMLELVELKGMGPRLPRQLSGGQQQRVALARALVTRPRVLLLDEKLRTQMQVELRQLQQELKITAIFVTHDQEEALTLSDRIAVMNGGRICQIGQPQQVYERPQTRFVSNFLGQSNFFEGKLLEVEGEAALLETAQGHRLRSNARSGRQAGQAGTLVVRPEKVRIFRQPPDLPNVIPARIFHRVYMGTSTTYLMQPAQGEQILAFNQNEESELAFQLHEDVYAAWGADACFLLED
jgi:spermidine/putrescine ABC transporter ATP-binding subunit